MQNFVPLSHFYAAPPPHLLVIPWMTGTLVTRTSDGSGIDGIATYLTDDPWPSTLPGVPA